MSDKSRIGNAWLCVAEGETDRPVALLAKSRNEVRKFLASEWIGDDTDPELSEAMAEFDKHDWHGGSLRWKFEIGSVEIADVFVAEQPKAEPTDCNHCGGLGELTGEYPGIACPSCIGTGKAPPAPAVPETWKPILEAVIREMPRALRLSHRDPGNAPGHAHDVPGIWDRDNGELAGKPCAWCLAWNTAVAMLASAPEPPK